MPLDRMRYERFGPAGLCEVDLEGGDAVEAGERVDGARARDDRGSLGGERSHHRKADALARAGDDGDPSAELEIHHPPPRAGAASSTPSSQLSIAAATSSEPSPTMNRCGRPSNSR